jgi:esterase/lipase
MKKIFFSFLRFVLIFVVIFVLIIGFWPSPILATKSLELLDYPASLTKVEVIKKIDSDKVNPECQDIIMSHGQKQPKSIVIYHGFTNCPKQFTKLGGELFEKGYNVYIPRIPYHGFTNVMTDALQNLNSGDLLNTINDSYQIASGLGDKVDVIGISGGGNMALWAGYNYKANQVLAIAPLLAPTGYSNWQIPLMQKYVQLKTNEFRWWDNDAQDKPIGGPKHAYPRYTSKAGNAFLEVALDLQRRLNFDSNTTATDFKLLLLESDQAVDNIVANEYFDLIDEKALHMSPRKIISASYNLNHDIIDPMQNQANTDLTYPIILDMLK